MNFFMFPWMVKVTFTILRLCKKEYETFLVPKYFKQKCPPLLYGFVM